jgi:hypothetical protein
VLDVLEQSWCGAKAGELERVIRESGIESHLATWSG